MTDQDLQSRIESSPRLKAFGNQLLSSVTFHADAPAKFDPILVVMIISIIVQVVIHCRQNKTTEELVQDIRDIRTMPPRRLMRLRRRMNALWSNTASDTTWRSNQPNPILTALYDLSESADDATLAELVALAE